jgi:hypothetical protein
VCTACSTPRINQRFELRPNWNNIYDTFPTGTAQDTTTEIQTTLSLPYYEYIDMFIDIRGWDDFVNAILQ